MCRMLIILGKKILGEELLRLYTSLVKSSQRDPYGDNITGKKGFSHSDGWGRVIVFFNGKNVLSKIHYEKSIKPIFNDNPSPVSNGYSTMFVEFVHARASSRNMPVNLASTHPIAYFTRKGEPLYIIHNGSVYKDELARITGSGINEIQLYNDTYFLAKYLGSLGRLDDEKHVYESRQYVNSALNIGLLLIQKDGLQVTVGSYYRDDDGGKRKDYYKMYMGEDEDKIIYASSTLIDYYNPGINIEWRELENGEYHIYRLDGEKIWRTHKFII